jgi:hypothetical protein
MTADGVLAADPYLPFQILSFFNLFPSNSEKISTGV